MDRSQCVQEIFDSFLGERKKILNDIEDFLEMALNHLNHCANRNEIEIPTAMISHQIDIYLGSFLKSLCLIHALYGYPKKKSDEEEEGKS